MIKTLRMRRLINNFFPASFAIYSYKTAKLNMTKLLAVANFEIGGKTKIKSCIPANTKKEKNKQVKNNLLV